jgi:hypothetical protein
MCAGSYGASHGAKIAQMVKNMTKPMPIVASGLRRASRGSEMALAAKVVAPDENRGLSVQKQQRLGQRFWIRRESDSSK